MKIHEVHVERLLGRKVTDADGKVVGRIEEMRTGTLKALADHYAAVDTPKGEIVICVGPAEAKADEPAQVNLR